MIFQKKGLSVVETAGGGLRFILGGATSDLSDSEIGSLEHALRAWREARLTKRHLAEHARLSTSEATKDDGRVFIGGMTNSMVRG